MQKAVKKEKIMESKIEDYISYLKVLIDDKKNEIMSLTQEQRFDEANHAKIQLNVLEIFEKMFSIGYQKAKPLIQSDEEKAMEVLSSTYLNYFDKIPQNWLINLEKSIQYHDIETEHIEKLKISQANTIKKHFIEVMQKEA